MERSQKNKGYMIIITTLMVGLITTSLVVSSLIRSSNSSSNSLEQQNYLTAYNLAELCGEEALHTIRQDNTYASSTTINFDYGYCTIEVINKGSENRQINNEGFAGNSQTKIEIETDQITPQINIASWEEVAEFTP